jgi:SAM-dependent methyltransferase
MNEFDDPRLVAVYDTINAYDPGTQPDFYAALAAEVGATIIVDVGCGTGLITRRLAGEGYRMLAVDPSPPMIDVARRRPVDGSIEWLVGDVSQVGRGVADMAFMSGHVAQFFLDDQDWARALAALHAALRPRGWLAFESRNPSARQWLRWTADSTGLVFDPVAGPIETWSEFHRIDGDVVAYTNHYAFVATGDELLSPNRLRFRTADQLTGSLASAGFEVRAMYGDWDRRPVADDARELIVVAQRS